jgi:hypothetical protein
VGSREWTEREEYPISNVQFPMTIWTLEVGHWKFIMGPRQGEFYPEKVATLNQDLTFITKPTDTVEKFFNLNFFEEII